MMPGMGMGGSSSVSCPGGEEEEEDPVAFFSTHSRTSAMLEVSDP